MTWSPDGPSTDTLTRQGWTPDGPDPVAVESKRGWTWVPQADALDDAGAQDVTAVHPKLIGVGSGAVGDSLYMGTDPTQDFELRIPIRDNAGAQGLATVRPREAGRDDAVLGDLAHLGVIGLDSGAAGDFATAKLAVTARDNAASGDLVTVKPGMPARDAGGGGDAATAGFSAYAAASTAYNSAAGTFTYAIPVWSRYLVLVGIGGGASGMTGNGSINQSGTGGAAGKWSSTILERGVHVPWSATSIAVVVGAGGASPASSDWAAAIAGSATTFAVSGSTILTCSGGSGTNGGTNGGGIREGQAAGNYSVDGDTYTGGSDQPSGNGAAGNPPGAGGAGGNGGIFGSRTRGGAGARGGAWIKARQ